MLFFSLQETIMWVYRQQTVGAHWHQILAHLYLSGANQCLLNECNPLDLTLLLMLRDPMLTLWRQFVDITSYITFVLIVRLPSIYCSGWKKKSLLHLRAFYWTLLWRQRIEPTLPQTFLIVQDTNVLNGVQTVMPALTIHLKWHDGLVFRLVLTSNDFKI